ncbi:hypothetical protein A0O30_08485 [Pseudomonas sp. LLC-1]|uniref:hypothetical protein n=1 Tax=Pseudomonas sp. LLC-1 TaxID=1812180 RepID=UPI000D020D23|nr:hypothetical protein [Pseudomonas sp. LLC-1]PRN05313.1 hypothetical protein A0O30_08485 [Pseudomonas sp. LLC-1]
MTISNQVRRLEIVKRRALWALADLRPGDARAETLLLELDEVNQALAELLPGDELTGQELTNAIEIQSHSGQRLIIEDSIPEPWRQRFSAASVGSTRLAAGPYFRDFQKFVMSWNDEMEHLKAHRASRQEGA